MNKETADFIDSERRVVETLRGALAFGLVPDDLKAQCQESITDAQTRLAGLEAGTVYVTRT